jgi:hypothetical protein
VDLSSSLDEEGLIPDTSQYAESAKRLFNDLNRDILGPPGDGKVNVLSDFDEEEEVHEEINADTDAAPSIVGIPALTTSIADTD